MRNNKEWNLKFRERLLDFSVRIILLVDKLPKTPAGYAIANQLTKSATSIGTNIEEAQDASSTKDFIQKLGISLRESRESFYWLKVIKKSKFITAQIIDPELTECDEFVSILVSSIKTSKLKLK